MNNLKEELTLEILWRYRELKNIKILYDSNIIVKPIGTSNLTSIINSPQSKYIMRSAVPVIYAHWEGFFKKAIEILNTELDKLNVDFNRLDNVLLSILLKDKHTIKYKNTKFKFAEIVIDTESNLSWKVIEKFSNRYNFNIKSFEKHKPIIQQLLTTRNGISHGENAYHFDNFNKINQFIRTVIKLMILLRNNILDCLVHKTYYRRSIND